VIEYKIFVFYFLYNFFSETFLIPRRIQRDVIKYYVVVRVGTSYSCQILTKLEFSRQISKNAYILWKSVKREPSVPCGRTDRHDEANSLFRNYANAPKNMCYFYQS